MNFADQVRNVMANKSRVIPGKTPKAGGDNKLAPVQSGEYVIPAPVVKAHGKDYFDNLVMSTLGTTQIPAGNAATGFEDGGWSEPEDGGWSEPDPIDQTYYGPDQWPTVDPERWYGSYPPGITRYYYNINNPGLNWWQQFQPPDWVDSPQEYRAWRHHAMNFSGDNTPNFSRQGNPSQMGTWRDYYGGGGAPKGNKWGFWGQNPGDNPDFVAWNQPEGFGPLTAGPRQPGWIGGTPYGDSPSNQPGWRGGGPLPGTPSNFGGGGGGSMPDTWGAAIGARTPYMRNFLMTRYGMTPSRWLLSHFGRRGPGVPQPVQGARHSGQQINTNV